MFTRFGLCKPWRGSPIAPVPTCGSFSSPGTPGAHHIVSRDSYPKPIRHLPPRSHLYQLKPAADLQAPSHNNPAVKMAPPGGSVWFITGTSSGFGRRLVSIVLAHGDRVIATAKTLASIAHFHDDTEPNRASNVHCAELDITAGTILVKERIDAIVHASGWGTVDVLVNNAGVGIPGFAEEGGVDVMRRQFETNLYGTLNVTTAVLPYMRRQGSGTVVIVGSRSAWRPQVKGLGFYAASKAAIHALAETLAVELEPFGIRMLVVAPGAFRTERIYRNNFDESNLIPDYDVQRAPAVKAFFSCAGKQPGDPNKAMKTLVEVVRGEGRAQGRAWPLYLVLGKDAEQDLRNKCARMIGDLDEWSDIVRDVDLDAPDHANL